MCLFFFFPRYLEKGNLKLYQISLESIVRLDNVDDDGLDDVRKL